MRAAVRKKVGGLLAALVVVAPLLLAAPTSAGEASPSPVPEGCGGASEESPVLVEVTRLLPRAPSLPEEPFQVAGRLRNCGQESLSDLQVRLAVGTRIRTRGELQRADAEPVVGGRRLLTLPTGEQELAPGESTPFDLRLLVRDLRLGGLGVYPLSVQARARYGGDGARTAVGLASTYVPWFPDGPPAPTRVAWLWPLIDQPRRGPAEVMLDDELDALVAPGRDDQPRGRLQELLVAAREGSKGACDEAAAPPPGTPRTPTAGCRGEPVPVTYAIDPSLLYSVEAMVAPGGYTVLLDGDKVDRPMSQNAEQWLVALRGAAVEQDVLALPFGDPDVVAMARSSAGLRDEVEQLRKLGQATVQRLLYEEDSPRRPLASVVWPPPGPVDASALDLLLGGQADAAVLDVDALPPASVSRNRTPSTRSELPSPYGATTGLVVEDVLSALVTPDPTRWQSPRLAEQRFLAETAIIAAEVPSESRTLLIAPARDADVAQAGVAAAMIADTGRLPWLCPVRLADVAEGQERCAALPDEQGPAAAEERTDTEGEVAERGDELSRSYLERLAQVQAEADQLTESVLVDGTEESTQTKARLLRAAGRAASAAWRDQPLLGSRMLDLLQDDVADLRSKVRLVSEPVTLTGGSGVLRLNVQNELGQPVNVGVRLDQTSSARLSSADTGVQVVPARFSTQIEVRVEPQTSGRFVVEAVLVDEEGRAFGEPVELDVRSTQYGRVALGVTGVAAAVLMVAAGARITRRAMRRSA